MYTHVTGIAYCSQKFIIVQCIFYFIQNIIFLSLRVSFLIILILFNKFILSIYWAIFPFNSYNNCLLVVDIKTMNYEHFDMHIYEHT